MKRCSYITCWTDAHFPELGDVGHARAPIRHVQVLAYGDGWATVMDLATEAIEFVEVKRLYRKPERWHAHIRRYGGTTTVHKPRYFGPGPSVAPNVIYWVVSPRHVSIRKLERMIPCIKD